MNSIVRACKPLASLIVACILASICLLFAGCGGGGKSGSSLATEFRILVRVPTEGHSLFRFASNNRNSTLVGPSFNQSELAGITQWPIDGMLYTYGTDIDTIFSFDPDTGEMFLHGSSGIDLPFTEYGMDIDPVTNHLRMVSGSANERIDLLNDVHLATDTPPTPPTGIEAIAYTPKTGNPGNTTLYGIDQGNVNLVRIGGVNGSPSPNQGGVEIIGSLEISNEMIQGFDIASDGTAYLLTVRQGDDSVFLYTVNLATGLATQVGQVAGDVVPYGQGVIGFCIVDSQNP